MMGILSVLKSCLILTAVMILALAFIPSPLLLDLEPEAFTTTPPVLDGPLARNSKLEKAEKLFENQIQNPECVDTKNGALYSGLEDGRVVELKDGKVRTVVRIGGSDCDKKEKGCGRPNGIKFGPDGRLVVADPLRGIYSIDVKTGEVNVLFYSDRPVGGRLAKGCNHPDVAKNGDVYFSDVSTKWNMFTNYYEFVEVAPNGRVLRYDANTKTTSVVADNLYFPNGVQLSPDEDFLLIAQSSKYNILKYHLTGSKKGEIEVFVENLPGVPDNIHSTERGTFWVGLAGARLPDKQPLFEQLGPYPLARKVIGRYIYYFSIVVDWIADNLPFPVLKTYRDIFNMKKLDLFLGPHYGFAIEFDKDGNILRAPQSPSGHLHHISHAKEHEGYLYLGSPFHSFIGKVPLN